MRRKPESPPAPEEKWLVAGETDRGSWAQVRWEESDDRAGDERRVGSAGEEGFNPQSAQGCGEGEGVNVKVHQSLTRTTSQL